MKKTTLVSVAVFFLVSGFATGAVAGIQPSPFHQFSAISLDVKILGKQLNEMLDMPVCDSSPRELRRAVVELHDLAFRLGGLNGFVTHIVWLPDETLDTSELTVEVATRLRRTVKSIIHRIDEFMGVPPEPCVPSEFIGAVLNVRAEAMVMLKNVKRYVSKLEELLDFITGFICVDDLDCGCTGDVTPCSSFNTETDCRGQDGCDWILNDARVGTCTGIAKPCDAINPSECPSQDGCANISCTNGLCLRTPDCYVNSDCPEGLECIFGFCSPEDFPPPVPGSCSVDGDCPEGSYCLFSVCVPDNAPIPCLCTTDSDCPPALNCVFGICLPF